MSFWAVIGLHSNHDEELNAVVEFIRCYNNVIYQLALQLAKMGKELSNLQKCLDLAMEFSSNLPSLWDLSDYSNKQRIQYLIFPEGIYVGKENRDYRTPKVNSVCLYLARLKRVL